MTSKSVKKVGIVSKVPTELWTIQLGNNNNVIRWLQKARNAAILILHRIPELADVIVTGVMPNKPTIHKVLADPEMLSQMDKMMQAEQLKAFCQYEANLLTESFILINFLEQNVDEQVKMRMSTFGDFAAVKSRKDLVAYIRILRNTLTGDPRSSADDSKDSAQQSYYNLKQESTEPLDDYRDRCLHHVSVLAGLGIAIEEYNQSTRFILGLDAHRFIHLQLDFSKLARLRPTDRVYPPNIPAAYIAAYCHHVIDEKTMTIVHAENAPTHNVFSTRDEPRSDLCRKFQAGSCSYGDKCRFSHATKHGGGGGGGGGGGSGAHRTGGGGGGGGGGGANKAAKPKKGDKPKKPKNIAPKDDKPQPNIKCIICGDGHWANKCPHKDEAEKVLAKYKSKGGFVASVTDHDDESVFTADEVIFCAEQSTIQSVFGTIFQLICSMINAISVLFNIAHQHRVGEHAIYAGETHEPSNKVVLDTGATCCVCGNPALVLDLQPLSRPVNIKGISGRAAITEAGTTVLANVPTFYCPNMVNIWSFHMISAVHKINYRTASDVFIVHIGAKELHFQHRGGVYVCDLTPHLDDKADAYVTTVEDTMKMFTKREVAKARLARDFQTRLGHCSPKDLKLLLSRGDITGMDFVAADVERAQQIWGPSQYQLKGKSVARTTPITQVEHVPRPILKLLKLFVDLFYVDGLIFFFSISFPLGLRMVVRLLSKSASDVTKALLSHISAYKSQHFVVGGLTTDGEGAIVVAETVVNSMGIIVDRAPSGTHVGAIERPIRTLKNSLRSQLASLPFKLSVLFMVWLVYYSVTLLNEMPNNQQIDMTPPKTTFQGFRPSADRFKFPFGAYVQAFDPSIRQKNSMDERTKGGIILMPTAAQAPSWRVFIFATESIVTRSVTQLTSLPMSVEVVAHLNKLAEKNKTHVSKDVQVRLGSQLLEDADDEPEPEDHPPMPALREPNPLAADALDKIIDEGPDGQHRGGDIDANQTQPDLPEADSVAAAPTQSNHGGDIPDPVVSDLPLPATSSNDNADVDNHVPEPIPDTHSIVASAATTKGGYNLRSRATTNSSHGVLHMSVKKAIKSLGKKATTALVDEILQIHNKGVINPVKARDLTASQRRNILRSHMFVKEKFLPTGEPDKVKARLVAGGDKQDKSLYSDEELSSPTVSTAATLVVAAIAAKENRTVVTVDIGGAYLNADMPADQEVYMRLDATNAMILCQIKPEYSRFLEPDGTMVVKLNKALYGCIESARLWYDNLSKTLMSFGFVRNDQDLCVFNLDSNGTQCTTIVHVDDMMITCVVESIIDSVIKHLTDVYKELTVHRGKVLSYVGMTFDFTSRGKVSITMEGYINDIIELYEIKGSAATPALDHLFDVRDNAVKLSPADRKVFHSRVMKLMYLAKRVRPDIITTVVFLSTRVLYADQDDAAKLDRVLRYLCSNREFGICLQPRDYVDIDAYVDASYGVHPGSLSHSGVIIMIGLGPIYIKSSKQKIVSKSSTEAELIALSDASSQVIWTRNFLISQGHELGPAKVRQDNKSTMAMVEKGRSTSERTRHISVRYFFIKDRVDSGELTIEYTPTKEMIADILTKPLQGDLFRKLRSQLLNWY